MVGITEKKLLIFRPQCKLLKKIAYLVRHGTNWFFQILHGVSSVDSIHRHSANEKKMFLFAPLWCKLQEKIAYSPHYGANRFFHILHVVQSKLGVPYIPL